FDEGAQVFFRKRLPRERRRICGKWLCRPRFLARHIGTRDGPLLNGPERLTRYAVEHPQETLFARLRHGIDHLAVVAHSDQFRGGRHVVIPDVVVDHLEMPQPLSGSGIEGEQTIAKEISSLAVGAVKVVLGAGGWYVNDGALLVDGQFAPTIGASHPFPGVFGPGIVAEFAGMRNRVECPG